MTGALPWDDVNATPSRQVAELLGLAKARERHKYACPACDSSDALHAYPGTGGRGGGFTCWSCNRSLSNVDAAAVRWGMEPADACQELAARLGIVLPEPGPAPTRQNGRQRTRKPNPAGNTPRRALSRQGANTDAKPEPDTRRAALEAELEEMRADGLPPAAPADIYRAVLLASGLTGRGAEYLASRGLDPDAAAGYGFRSLDDPAAWNELGGFLAESWIPAELERAGFWGSTEGDPAPRYLPSWSGRAPALVIPYLHGGQVAGLRFRNLAPGAPHGMRYRDLAGVQPLVPFNADALDAPELHVVEGELNTYTLHRYGLAAVGLPGAHGWRPEWAGQVKPAGRLVAWYDNDAAGDAGAAKLAGRLQEAHGAGWVREHVRRVRPPADANDLHTRGELHGRIERAAWRD